MTPIIGITASSVTPFLGGYNSIASTIVGSGGAADITFSNIPSNYQHLQLRGIARASGGASGTSTLQFQANGDTGSNYSSHFLIGDGGSVSSVAYTSDSYFAIGSINNDAAGIFATFVMDIFDYTSTNKHKTVKTLTGLDKNGSGNVALISSVWRNTTIAAITSLKITIAGLNFAQNSQIALYGIR